jgi:GDP-L-fucose synthase
MEKESKVLVTGGTGFLGKNLQKHRPSWTYISSKEFNLLSAREVETMIKCYKPESIIHLAAKVGGIKENANKQAEFYYQNTMMNTNILDCAYKCGVKRVLSSLSTCAFPNELSKYPFSEESLFDGPPAETNFSYGYTKRALHVQTLSYRKQYGINYSTFCPSNIYGPEDNFNSNSSHFVPALIRKVSEVKSGATVELWGSGEPLRQQLYVKDLVEIIPLLLEKHNSDVPLIVAPNENLSISNMANILRKNIKKDVKIKYNNKLDGQYRKDGSNEKLLNLIGDFKFTEFEEGVLKTYMWYEKNKR